MELQLFPLGLERSGTLKVGSSLIECTSTNKSGHDEKRIREREQRRKLARIVRAGQTGDLTWKTKFQHQHE